MSFVPETISFVQELYRRFQSPRNNASCLNIKICDYTIIEADAGLITWFRLREKRIRNCLKAQAPKLNNSCKQQSIRSDYVKDQKEGALGNPSLGCEQKRDYVEGRESGPQLTCGELLCVQHMKEKRTE